MTDDIPAPQPPPPRHGRGAPAAQSADHVLALGPRARDIFGLTFRLIQRAWKETLVVGGALLVFQLLTTWLFYRGLDDAFRGRLAEFLEQLEAGEFVEPDLHLPRSAIVRFIASAVLGFASFCVFHTAWLRQFMSARNGRRLTPGAAIRDAARLAPRVAGNWLLAAAPFAAMLGLLILSIVGAPALAILALPLMIVTVFVAVLVVNMVLGAASISPRSRSAARHGWQLVRQRPSHAAKLELVAILATMLVGVGASAFNQIGILVGGIAGSMALSSVGTVLQLGAQAAALSAMYVSLDGEVDQNLTRPA